MREREIGDEDDNSMEDTSGDEKSEGQLAALGLEDLVSVLLPTGLGLIPAGSGMYN